jgi:hypothetical protein
MFVLIVSRHQGEVRKKKTLPEGFMLPYEDHDFFLLASLVYCLGETLGFVLRLTEEKKAEVTEKEVKKDEKQDFGNVFGSTIGSGRNRYACCKALGICYWDGSTCKRQCTS